MLPPVLLELGVFFTSCPLMETFFFQTGTISPQKNSDSYRRPAPVLCWCSGNGTQRTDSLVKFLSNLEMVAQTLQSSVYLTIDSCFCVQYRDIMHAVSLESTNEAQQLIDVIDEAAFTLRRRNVKSSFVFTVRSTVHTTPSRKRSFTKTLFKPDEFENAVFAF